jgi:nicotinamide-nucleotide amidase
MSRESASTQNRVAVLATGDEIINGDILNSNSQVIAQILFSHGIPMGLHMAVPDNIDAIEQAIRHLLKTHRALIITGGLGPTSDDLTRYALSNALQRPLIHDEPTWQSICERFQILGYKGEPPEGNLQQALFPEGAIIIPNPNGTAAGCRIEHQERHVFMLPGPPFECLPMVNKFVLPILKQHAFQEISYYDHWLLFGIGESLIANQLDALAKPFNCTTGYRIAFPYVEFKLSSNHEEDFNTLRPLIEAAIAPYLLNDGKQFASVELSKKLEQYKGTLKIRDLATGGLLENTLLTPSTYANVSFSAEDKVDIEIRGLKEYWSGEDTETTLLELHFPNGHVIQKDVHLRGRTPRVKQFVVEFVCYHLLQLLAK